jgi:hypothetical protein
MLGDNSSGPSSFGYNPDGTPDCSSLWSYVNPALNVECLPGAAVTAGGQLVAGAANATTSSLFDSTMGVPTWLWLAGAGLLAFIIYRDSLK